MYKLKTKIKVLREAAGLTQKELGDKIGKSAATVRSYEKGNTSPSATTLEKIAKATNVEIEEMFI